MAKSKIIKQLANNEITLEVALNRLLIISSDINNDKLAKWVECELNGYDSDNVPPYRIMKNTMFVYSGINGGFQVTNAPLPLHNIFQGNDKEMFYIKYRDGIKIIEDFINADDGKELGQDITHMAGIIEEMFGIQCLSIKQIINKNSVASILNNVKTTLLKIFIQLDKEYGNLNDLDIDTSSKTPEQVSQINTMIINYIYADNSISIGDKNKINDSKIGK